MKATLKKVNVLLLGSAQFRKIFRGKFRVHTGMAWLLTCLYGFDGTHRVRTRTLDLMMDGTK